VGSYALAAFAFYVAGICAVAVFKVNLNIWTSFSQNLAHLFTCTIINKDKIFPYKNETIERKSLGASCGNAHLFVH
jgi:hypothetical protein